MTTTTPAAPYYGAYDFGPVRYSTTEAWLWIAARGWVEVDAREVYGVASMLSEAAYLAHFGALDLPPLPAAAFRRP